MKLNFRRIFAAVMFLFLMLFFSVMFVGCSASKKHKEEEKTKVEVSTKVDSSSTVSVKSEEKVTEENKTVESVKEKTLEIEVKNGEELEVTNYDAKGNKTGSTTYKGSGKAKETISDKKTESKQTKESQLKTDSKSKTDLSKRAYAKAKGKKLVSEKENKGFSFFDYLFWIILLIVLSILYYLNKRFKWIGSIINWLNN